MMRSLILAAVIAGVPMLPRLAIAEESGSETAAAATDRAAVRQAMRMMKQAEEHIAIGEADAAVALYEKIIQRFDKQPLAFTAHLGMGRLFFGEGEYERALEHFGRAAQAGTGPKAVVNEDLGERTEALFHVGMCHVQMGQPERCFPSFRNVIEIAPGSPYANQAYFQIAEAHFVAGNYSQAITNYRMVGTSLDDEQKDSGLVELGKPLYVRIEDKDLLILDGEPITMALTTDEGDREEMTLRPMLPGSATYVGYLATGLGPPQPGNRRIDGNGSTIVDLFYVDKHTAAGELDVPRKQSMTMVGTGEVAATDGAFRDDVSQVILDDGRGSLNLRVIDPDRDSGSPTDSVEIEIVVEKPLPPEEPEPGEVLSEEDQEPQWEVRSSTRATLNESEIQRRGAIDLSDWTIGADDEASKDEPRFSTGAVDVGMRTGSFTGQVAMAEAEGSGVPEGTAAVQIGDRITIRYIDEKHLHGSEAINRTYQVTVVPGTISKLTLAGTLLNDANIKVRKELLQAETSLRIGEVYRDMGLERHAQERFQAALMECQRVGNTEGIYDRELREQTLYTLWRIFLAKGALREAAKACRTLQEEFPESDYVDDSLLAMGRAAQAAGQYDQAVQLFQQVAALPGGSLLAPEALFEVGRSFEDRIERIQDGQVREDQGMRQRAINAYRQVFSTFPDSSYAGEALKKTGDFYFQERNYQQAIDFFEKVLRDYPDAPFIADVLFNLARSNFLKGDLETTASLIGRIERDHPGFERMDQVRKLRAFVRRSQGSGGQ